MRYTEELQVNILFNQLPPTHVDIRYFERIRHKGREEDPTWDPPGATLEGRTILHRHLSILAN